MDLPVLHMLRKIEKKTKKKKTPNFRWKKTNDWWRKRNNIPGEIIDYTHGTEISFVSIRLVIKWYTSKSYLPAKINVGMAKSSLTERPKRFFLVMVKKPLIRSYPIRNTLLLFVEEISFNDGEKRWNMLSLNENGRRNASPQGFSNWGITELQVRRRIEMVMGWTSAWVIK